LLVYVCQLKFEFSQSRSSILIPRNKSKSCAVGEDPKSICELF
jgi:hypothetical protein